MRFERLAAAIILLVGSASAGVVQDTVVAVDPDTVTSEGEDVVHYWGVNETVVDEEYDGTADIIIVPDDEWEAGNPWDPNANSTREGSDLGGNPTDDMGNIVFGVGDEVVTGPVMEVFDGRDVKESLATELGLGGGARGQGRGQGRPADGIRNLRGNKA